jgi:hypothetical protein
VDVDTSRSSFQIGNKIKYMNFAFETKLSEMEIKSPTGETLTLKGLDAQSRAIDLASKALDKVP